MSAKYHHVYAQETERGWHGLCEDCDFETDSFEQEPKFSIAECLRKHPQHPPMVVLAFPTLRPAESKSDGGEA